MAALPGSQREGPSPSFKEFHLIPRSEKSPFDQLIVKLIWVLLHRKNPSPHRRLSSVMGVTARHVTGPAHIQGGD